MRFRRALFAAFFLIAAPALAYQMSAWVVTWDQRSADSMRKFGSSVDEANPVWFTLATDGSIVTASEADNYRWRAAVSGTEVTRLA